MADLPQDPVESRREKVRIWLQALATQTPPLTFNFPGGYNITLHSWTWEGRNDAFLAVVTVTKQATTIFDMETIRIINPPLVVDGQENPLQAVRAVVRDLIAWKEARL